MRNDNGRSKKWLKKAAVLLLVIIVGAGTLMLSGCGDNGGIASAPEKIINPITGDEVESEDSLPARPVMVSIPNDTYGAVPQSNISYADIIYEFPVEGELTRLQAVYYSKFPDEFGPTRSVRYYFVDLAREYQAAHVGYGWGKRAHSYMQSSDIPHINGMQDTDLFYRNSEKTAPNDAYIKWSDIQARADEEGWFSERKTIKAFKFRDDEWKAAMKEQKAEAKDTVKKLKDSGDSEDQAAVSKAEALLAGPEKASSLTVKSLGCNSECVYNEETGKYDRFWYGEKYVDKETGKQLSFANVLVQKVHSDIMIDEETGLEDEKGRLEINMNSSGEALLFTNGEVVKGTWSKKTPDSRTIFKDENGKQFRFSQGKTWVYVLDQNMTLDYTSADEAADDSSNAE